MNPARAHKRSSKKSESKGSRSNLFVVAKKSSSGKKPIIGSKGKGGPLFVPPKKKGKKKKEVKKAIPVKEQVEEEVKIIKTPTKPSEDSAFKKTIAHIKSTKEVQEKHQPSENKLTEVKDAAILTESEQRKKNDQGAHFESIKKTSEASKKKKFTPESFKKLLKKDLDKLEEELPHSESEAKKFKRDKPLDDVKKNVSGNVNKEKEAIAGPLATDAKVADPPKSNLAVVAAKPIPKDEVGPLPKPINKRSAVPKPKHKTEISMEKESASLDEVMEENEVTDNQLANANEPKFSEALDSKKEAKKEAVNAPKTYRKKENSVLWGAKKKAGIEGEKGLHGMFESRLGNFGGVLNTQKSSEKSDKDEQKRINAEFKKIYDKTKKGVTEKLDGISDKVDKFFEEDGAVDKAKKKFESNVEEQLGEIYGWTTIDDWLFGEDTEAIEKVFVKEKEKFIKALDGIFDKIAVIISTGLNDAIKIIDDGRTDTKKFYDGLDKKQKELAEDALETFNDKYDDLEETVKSKEAELAQELAKKYKENVDSLREKFDEIKKKVSATFIEAAFNFIKGVIETILKIKNLLFNLIAAVVDAIKAIIADPIGFLKNLFYGIKLGFENFFTNIKTHLITALIEWLTGSLGGIGIKIPKDLFSLKGIFNLVMQILGLTWDYFRSKAVKLLGEPVVKAMEKTVEVFDIIRKKGVNGLWEYIKEQFHDLKEVVMDAIRDMVITKVVEAGIKWIMGLMSPAGAFVKAAMLIIDVVRFFVERAAQILELVNAFINGIRALANGSVEKLAASIEKALAKTLPVLIGFLAALVGVTGLTGKVQKIIKRIRKRIDKAINKVIKKAKKAFKGLVKKGKAKVKGLIEWWKKKLKFKTSDGKSHSLSFKGKGKNAKLMRASNNPQELVVYLKGLDIKSDDPRHSKVTEALTISKDIKLITRTAGVSGKAKNTDKKIEKDITKKMTRLTVILVDLVNLSAADVPASAKWVYSKSGGKKRAKVEELSFKSATGGSGAAGNTPEMTFVAAEPWVRMHLISAAVGGKGKIENWVPAPVKVNSSGAVLHSFENSAERLVRSKEIPASYGLRAKSARKEQPNVIWMDVKVVENHPPSPKYKDLSGTELTEFAKKIIFRFGVYFPPKPGKTKWEKVDKSLSTQSVDIDPPPSGDHDTLYLSKAVRTEMRKTRIPHFVNPTYGERLIQNIKDSKPFGSWDKLKDKLETKVAASKKPVYSKEDVATIIDDLKANPKVDI